MLDDGRWHSPTRYGREKSEEGSIDLGFAKKQETAGWARMYACVVILMVDSCFFPMMGENRERFAK